MELEKVRYKLFFYIWQHRNRLFEKPSNYNEKNGEGIIIITL